MLQEDSNGEASFEIIDKKNEDSSNGGDKTESLSSVSSAYSIPSLPGGNLLSNLPPPTNLPDFTILRSPQPIPAPSPLPPNLLPPSIQESKPVPPVNLQVFPQPQFSAAIPPSKGIQHGPVRQTSVDSTNQGSGGLIGWMKDAVSSGGILSKLSEKAKNSVDSIITTLDPQMSEFIYSGGDVEITVASQDQEELAPIRDAIFSVFGKAWVNGANIKLENKHQAVGVEEGFKRAEEKLKAALALNRVPIVAVENILLQQNEEWFDLSILLLKDPEKEIYVHTYTQTTPIPLDLFLDRAEKELPGYAKECDSVAKLLAAYLQIARNNNWQQDICGVSRRETLFLAAKSLMSVYKNKLIVTQ